jgi:glucokinase
MLAEVNQPFIAGLDLGGTDIKRGASDLAGNPLSDTLKTAKLPSLVKSGPAATVEQFSRAIEELQSRYGDNLVAIGLATAGPATLAGVIERSTNYGSLWNDCDILGLVKQRFSLPATYENDANAAVLAEYNRLMQQRPELKNVPGLLLTIGTGLGGGVINSSGELERGAYGLGAELGHLPIRSPISSVDLQQQGITCGCGAIGCAEQYTTLSFIEREVIARRNDSLNYQLNSYEDSREAAKQVLTLAVNGDAFSRSIIIDQAINVGKLLGDQIIDKDPGWALIGGGITEADEYIRHVYLETVLQHVQQRIGDKRMERVLISYATLGDNAGWVGATISAAELLSRC